MEQLTNMLNELATKLGTTTEYLWGILIKQAQLAAITNLIISIILFLMAATALKFCVIFFKKIEIDSDYEVPFGLSLIIGTMLIVVALVTLHASIVAFINPEYWALQKILN